MFHYYTHYCVYVCHHVIITVLIIVLLHVYNVIIIIELIITSGGENIAPVPIEARIKKYAPFLSNVTLIGDKRKFVSCLVTIKVSRRVTMI